MDDPQKHSANESQSQMTTANPADTTQKRYIFTQKQMRFSLRWGRVQDTGSDWKWLHFF